jgi:tetratricopeptide (TPR) repeat protein
MEHQKKTNKHRLLSPLVVIIALASAGAASAAKDGQSDSSMKQATFGQSPVDKHGKLIRRKRKPITNRNYLRGEQLASFGEDEEAVKSFNLAMIDEPGNLEFLKARGRSYLEMQHFNEAIADFTKCINGKCNDLPSLYYHRGVAFAKQNKIKEALKDYNEGIRLEEETGDVSGQLKRLWMRRGRCYQLMNKPDLAMQDYNNCVKHQMERVDAGTVRLWRRQILENKK